MLHQDRRILLNHVSYCYAEEQAVLRVQYDPVANEVIIAGGRHGFAKLAELCAYYAIASSRNDHAHWWDLHLSDTLLTIVVEVDPKAVEK